MLIAITIGRVIAFLFQTIDLLSSVLSMVDGLFWLQSRKEMTINGSKSKKVG